MPSEKVDNVPAVPVTAELEHYQKLGAELWELAEMDSGESNEIARAVTNEIAQAETLEAIFAANDSGPMNVQEEDIIDAPIWVYDIRYWRSAEKYRKNNLGVYVVLDVFFDGGEPFKVTTGAPNVVASIRQMQRLGLINPATSKMVHLVFRSRETGNGHLITVGPVPKTKTK